MEANRYGSRSKPTGGAEMYAWIFMRLSGILLVFLAVGHMLIMHVFNSIHHIDYDFVAARWANKFWRGYDLALLWLALIHGLNGLRTVMDDYIRPPGAKKLAIAVLYFTGIFFLILGSWAIIAFQPVAK